jgi:hypothetical protein
MLAATHLPSQPLTSPTAVSGVCPGSSLQLRPTEAVCGSTFSAVPACSLVTAHVVRTCATAGEQQDTHSLYGTVLVCMCVMLKLPRVPHSRH